METCESIRSNGTSITQQKDNSNKRVDGLNNWVLAFFIIFCSNVVYENITTYGIRKSPVGVTYDFIGFMQENWWCYALMFSAYLFQIVLCYLNEKLLALGIVAEWIGMTLHLFIALLSLNVCSILCLIYKFNPVAGVVAMAHILLISVKFWSFAYENHKLREVYNSNLYTKKLDLNGTVKYEVTAKKTIKYPDNVTLKNIIQFVAMTPACIYRIDGHSPKPPNYKKLLKGIPLAIFCFYIATLLIHQFIFPELEKVISYMNNGYYVNIFGSVLKLVLPVNLTWLSFFYFYCFAFYLPAHGWFWGTEDILVAEDWWNSENSTIFWTKWNYQVHMWFKENFFLPALKMGYSRRTAGLVVGCVSGILHEYLITVPCRCCYGIPTFTMLSQIPLAYLTTFIQHKFGSKWSNLVVWFSLILGHTSCMILIYYNYLQT